MFSREPSLAYLFFKATPTTPCTPSHGPTPHIHFLVRKTCAKRSDAYVVNMPLYLSFSFLMYSIFSSWRSAYPHLLGHPMKCPSVDVIPALSSALFVSLRDANAPTSPWQQNILRGSNTWPGHVGICKVASPVPAFYRLLSL